MGDFVKLVFLAILGVLSTPAFTSDKVIYGVDDRVDIEEAQNILYKHWANSTAVQINKRFIREENGSSKLLFAPLSYTMNVCKEEKYSEQNAIGECSGFLISNDLLVTAGHCMTEERCQEYNWVFEYYKNEIVDNKIPSENVYGCQEIYKVDYSTDFAIIKLDRPVTGRKFLRIRQKGELPLFARLAVIGNPSGLPTKVTDNIMIYDTSHPTFFTMNADTYGGNSGSAVINVDSFEVEGILVRGAKDYVKKEGEQCYVSNYCPEISFTDGCLGESATRITHLLEYL